MNDTALNPRYQALIQLLRTAETLWQSSRALFSRWDLSPSQFNVLNLLRDSPDGISQTDLSRELLMHRSNATGLVDRLEERHLVKRRNTPGDRRAYRVVLTPHGMRLLKEILPHYYHASEAVFDGVDEQAGVRLKLCLERMTQNAERLAREYTL